MKKIVFILLLFSLSFASLLGQYNTGQRIIGAPIVYQNNIVFASADGNIYSVRSSCDTLVWKRFVGKEPNEVFVFDNSIVTSTTSGKVSKIDNKGIIVWTIDLGNYNATHAYGANANNENIFVTTDSGVYSIGKTGVVKILVQFENNALTAGVMKYPMTTPAAGKDFIIYGKGDELVKIDNKGKILWKAKLDQGSFWLSRPVIDGSVVYIGALDNKMHAYAISNGQEVWTVNTKNWILSTPFIEQGMLYFGGNDGTVYAVSTGSGSAMWKTQTQRTVQTQATSGYMGGEDVIFVGSGDKGIYAISKTDGSIVWKGGTASAVGSPLFYLNSVIFGSQDGTMYCYSTERACSINTPQEAELIGRKELVVSGKYVSENSGARVEININNGEWEATQQDSNDWEYYTDPTQKLVSGLNIITCRVVDTGGQELGPSYTSVAINHNPTEPLSEIKVAISPKVIEGQNFTIYVNDGDDGSQIERFTLLLNGETYTGSDNISTMIPQAGAYEVTVSKIGFNNKKTVINVNPNGINPVFVIIGILGIIVIIWLVWTKFIKQRFAKKEDKIEIIQQ
ncbi:PQQ-like beta-propeller repeat protein [Candidatus Micrarchaeota archaeon]|nr:PQQ-like beta-propeller repeat protein [Candidatus Micrarchaeota archaeon]